MNYQRLVIAGNATRDAESRTSKDGDVAYTRLSVAVSDSKDRSTYFPVTVFGKQAGPVAEYVRKGDLVLVEGRIEVDDERRFSVIADRVVFGPPARESES